MPSWSGPRISGVSTAWNPENDVGPTTRLVLYEINCCERSGYMVIFCSNDCGLGVCIPVTAESWELAYLSTRLTCSQFFTGYVLCRGSSTFVSTSTVLEIWASFIRAYTT